MSVISDNVGISIVGLVGARSWTRLPTLKPVIYVSGVYEENVDTGITNVTKGLGTDPYPTQSVLVIALYELLVL